MGRAGLGWGGGQATLARAAHICVFRAATSAHPALPPAMQSYVTLLSPPARALPCPVPCRSVVNIKAKTHEKVDSLGENRSIACHAVVMLLRQ